MTDRTSYGNSAAAPTPAHAPAQADTLQVTEQLLALASGVLAPIEVGGTRWLVLPAGFKHTDITEAVVKAQPAPDRKSGTVHVKDVASLLLYMADQVAANGANVTAYVFADPDARTITTVFNDQRAPVSGWRDHRAVFKAEYTPEFQLWLNNSKQQRDQASFAEFIEDNFADIAAPFAQQLLEVATTIQAKTGINFSSSKRLQDGQTQLAYTEVIDATAGASGGLTIPREFELGMRIFKNGGGYKLKARLKFRLNTGSVKFWYELDRPERSVEDAFKGYVEQVREQSGYAVLLGAAG